MYCLHNYYTFSPWLEAANSKWAAAAGSLSSKEQAPFKAAASAALGAVHAALDNPHQCDYFLQGRHDIRLTDLTKNAEAEQQTSHSMFAVIHNLEGRLPAQLTAAACVMRLCLAEIQHKEKSNPPRARDDVGSYCLAALNGGWFGDIVKVMRSALQVLYLP